MTESEFFKITNHLHKENIQSRILNHEGAPSLILDCELPGGSYKMRGVENYFSRLSRFESHFQVLSAGNLALACAINSRKYGAQCTAIVPESISKIKEQKLKAAGAHLRKMPYSLIWEQAKDQSLIKQNNYLHPLNSDLLSGYGTIVCDLAKKIENWDHIVIPFGLGGLALGLTRAICCFNLSLKVHLVELNNHSPFQDALRGRTSSRSPYSGFVEALGTPEVIPSVFDELKQKIAEVHTVSENEVEKAIRELYQTYGIVVEGAAGAAFAVSKMIQKERTGSTLVVLTGQNITPTIHKRILTNG